MNIYKDYVLQIIFYIHADLHSINVHCLYATTPSVNSVFFWGSFWGHLGCSY
jgi:hypothetical protein